jgi:hypothetical protein
MLAFAPYLPVPWIAGLSSSHPSLEVSFIVENGRKKKYIGVNVFARRTGMGRYPFTHVEGC